MITHVELVREIWQVVYNGKKKYSLSFLDLLYIQKFSQNCWYSLLYYLVTFMLGVTASLLIFPPFPISSFSHRLSNLFCITD